MKNICFVAVAAAAALLIGCGEQGTDAGAGGPASTSTTPVVYCGKCGQLAESAICCKADAAKCECGMVEGSPLCCVEIPEELKGKNICACGYEAGSENCCNEGAETCSKCNMIEGSTMCCKIGVEGTGMHDHDEGHGHDDDKGHDHDHDDDPGHDNDNDGDDG